jgi:tol-pal system protein YbgF
VKSFLGFAAAAVALSGCALKGDVRRVEAQVQELRVETARADTARAVELARITALFEVVHDSLDALQRRLLFMNAEVRSDLTEVQRLLLEVQELTGQSQQRLRELSRELERRAESPRVIDAAGSPDSTGAVVPTGVPSPDELYDVSLSQLRRGSPQTARAGFRQFLESYPTHDRVPDALFFIGESWAGSEPDSATAAYQAVVDDHPDSRRAPTSLYKLGLLAEERGDLETARLFYNRVIAGYPRSEAAELARQKLNPGP